MTTKLLLTFKQVWLVALMAVLSTGTAFAQKTISGTITDSRTGDGLIGASILIEGTTVGTLADENGRFSLQASEGDVLNISYVGYTGQKLTIGSASEYNVSLVEGQLDEVVITGYTAQSKKKISGAVSSIVADDIANIPNASVSNRLQGKVSGVNVTQSGAPGSGVSVRIRGYGTIGNNEPLYIVDGIPLQGMNTLLDINPNDVESIQVLKDASAASIYGARAANGVIIVTTKKGSARGGTTVTFDGYVGVETNGAFPEMLSSQELGDVIFEQQRNAGLTPSHAQYGNGATAVIPEYIFPAGGRSGAPETDLSLYDQVSYPITRTAPGEGTDWWDVGWNPGMMQNYNVGITGGNEQAQFAVGTGYFMQEGTLLNSSYERYNVRANSLIRVKKWFRIGQTLNVSYSKKQNPNQSTGGQNENGIIASFYKGVPLIPLYDEGGNFAGDKGPQVGANGPFAELSRNADDYRRRFRMIGNVYGEIDIFDGLTAKSSINVDYNTSFNKDWVGRNYEAAEPRTAHVLNSYFDIGSTWTWYNTLNYNNTFGEHTINLLGGTEAIRNQYDFLSGQRIGYFSDAIDYRHINAGEPTGQTVNGSASQRALFSIFGKFDYDYQGKYIFSATVRRDGSSVFSEANRFGVFPAFSAAWRLSDEAFMQDVAFINDFKIRGGWGQTGNQEIGQRIFSTFGSNPEFNSYDINGSNSAEVTGFDSSVFGNPNVKWETTTSLNIGFDASFLSDRLGLSFDWFNNDTEDMLTEVPPSSLQGVASNPFINIGEVNNTGFDVELSLSSPASSELIYDFAVNVSRYKNEVTALATDAQEIISGGFRSFEATITRPGDPISSYYGLIIDGIFQNQAEVDAHAEQTGKDVGRWKFRDVNEDGVINDEDRTIMGSPHPDFAYGFTANLAYKGFDFSLFVQGVQGNEVFNTNVLFADLFQFQGNRRRKVIEQSWGYAGVNNETAELPQINQNAPVIEKDANSYYVEDGSYVRFKNATLGYTLPDAITNSIGLGKIRVYVAGNNFITITSYEGLDPEISVNNINSGGQDQDIAIGLDKGNYPVVRSVMGGVNITF